MNKKTEDKSLDFVAKFYRHGRLNTNEAIRRVSASYEKATHSILTGDTLKTEHGKDSRSPYIKLQRSRIYAVAASLLLLIVAGAWLYLGNRSDNVTILADDSTRTVMMPDGSCITLRPHSKISYDADNPRTLHLKGGAYFEVAHDESRPFTVDNGISMVRVLGTRFQIVQNDRYVSVYVSHGRVSFSSNAAHDSIILSRNQKAEITPNNSSPRMIPAGSANQTAWATGTLVFRNAAIEEVVADLSSCFNKQFYAPKTEKRLTAEFKTDNLQEILNIIKETTGVTITEKKQY